MLKKVIGPPRNPSPRAAGTPEAIMGKRIRLRRVELGMSQSRLGDALGLTFQQVQKYEKGVNRVGASRLEQIAGILDVPVTFFYGNGSAGASGNTIKQQGEMESLLFTDSRFSVRLLRAYHAINDQNVQRNIVRLMESLAGLDVEED